MENFIDITKHPYNATGDGITDQTDIIKLALDDAINLNLPLFLPEGEFIAKIDSISDSIYIFGNGKIKYNRTTICSGETPYIGIPHNISEQEYTFGKYITEGSIIAAPQLDNIPNKGIDIIAYWYNDFGLFRTAAHKNQKFGSHKWYDWSWNFNSKNNNPYDSKRHPILGFYRGDDVNVLDWICYWLGNNGIGSVVLSQVPSPDNWDSPLDYSYWIYQLFENTKNFKLLKYVLFTQSSNKKTETEIEYQNDRMIDGIISKYDNFHRYEKNDKNYVTLFCWDLEQIRGVYDKYKGNSRTLEYLVDYSRKLKLRGFDGLCLMARGYSKNQFDSQLEYLESNDVILLDCEYSYRYGKDEAYANSYSNYVNEVQFPVNFNNVVNVMTSAESRDHTSKWSLKGSTPMLFKKLVHKAVDHINNNNLPRMLTVYNVSEWAEGGASLIPNQQDLFGYLDAINKLTDDQDFNSHIS